eukprot:scaffold233_cov431-Pavlova_lutheri.AAC.1
MLPSASDQRSYGTQEIPSVERVTLCLLNSYPVGVCDAVLQIAADDALLSVGAGTASLATGEIVDGPWPCSATKALMAAAVG